jgi:hypothetical protein
LILIKAFDRFNIHWKTPEDEQIFLTSFFFVGSHVLATISKISNHPLFGKFIFNSINVANDDSFLKT